MRTLHIRVAAFVDTNTDNRDQNVIFYDLCNKNWETIKITHHGWSIEPNSDQVSFKRFRIMTEQILEKLSFRHYGPIHKAD
jgi:hypothetical protein